MRADLRLPAASSLERQPVSGSAGADGSPAKAYKREKHGRARQHLLRGRRSPKGLPGILQWLRQPRAVADPALPARPRRILAPRLAGYLRVNEHFASDLEKLLRPDDVVWVHDYHLIPLAKVLRDAATQTGSASFCIFRSAAGDPHGAAESRAAHSGALPLRPGRLPDRRSMPATSRAIWRTNAAAAVDVHHSFSCQRPRRARRHLSGRHRDRSRSARLARRAIAIRASVLVVVRRALIIGVDRLDYSKGIALAVGGVRALPRRHPEWRGKVTFLQITPQSRSEIPEYADLERLVGATAGRINGDYGEASWMPMRDINRAHSRTALAGLIAPRARRW